MESFLCVVVIWSDLLGGVHLWQSTLFWDCHFSSTERTALWPQTGQTKQYRLFWWNVSSNDTGIIRTRGGHLDYRTVFWYQDPSHFQCSKSVSNKTLCSWWLLPSLVAGKLWQFAGVPSLSNVQSSLILSRHSLIYLRPTLPIWNSMDDYFTMYSYNDIEILNIAVLCAYICTICIVSACCVLLNKAISYFLWPNLAAINLML